MGIAMLWIVFFHASISCSGALSWIKTIGYGGVDIFLFASGIGNYSSYLRDRDPLAFLKRRIQRLAPVYIPFIIIWLTYKLVMDTSFLKYTVGNFFAIQGFTSNGGEFNWYLTGILICYILTPYLAQFVSEHSTKQTALMILGLLLISVAFWNDKRLIISITRLPIYTIGMLFKKHEDKVLYIKSKLLLVITFLAGSAILFIAYRCFRQLLWNYGLHWYPFILITPGLCMIISFVISAIENKHWTSVLFRPILSFLSLVGKSSFETYLIHIFAFDILAGVNAKHPLSHKSLTYACVGLCAILFAIAVNYTITQVQKKKTRATN